VSLAERHNARVYVAPMSGRCGFPEDHPSFAGFLPAMREKIVELLCGHDLIFVLGAPDFTYHVEGSGPHVPDGAMLCQLIDDPNVAAWTPAGIAAVGNIQLGVLDLLARPAPNARALPAPRAPSPRAEPSEIMSVAFALQTLAEVRDVADIIVEEAPSSRPVMQAYLPITRSGTFYTMDSGGLGYGMPAAVGVALAKPGARVIGLIGDGSSMYSIQALYSAVQLKLPITFVVLNNSRYAALQLGPDIYGGTGSFDQYIPSARSDNTVVYKGTFSGLTFGAIWSFGRDAAGAGNSPGQGTCVGPVPGSSQTCREWSTMLRYDFNGYGVAGAYDEQRGGPGAAANFFDGTAPFALSDPGDKDVRMQLNGYGHIGPVKLGGGWLGRRVETVSPATPDVRSNLFYLTAAYNLTPAFIVDGGVYRIVNRQDDTRGTIGALRTTYLLSKRSAVYLQGAWLSNSAHAQYTVSQGGGGTTPAAGVGQLGVMAGIRHSF